MNWQPTSELIESSRLVAFMKAHGLASFAELHQRSTSDFGWFWSAVLVELGIRFTRPYSSIVDLSRGKPWPRWCVDGDMNIVDNLLDRYADTAIDNKAAIHWESEDGQSGSITYRELRAEVNQAANALRELGIRRGDAVAVFMPMSPKIVVAMLAIIKVGGIFLPLFSGYGAAAVASRLNDASAKAIFTADGAVRRGKTIPMKTVADEAADQCSTLRHVIVLRHAGCQVKWNAGRDVWWNELIPRQSTSATCAPTGADEPMMIIYTSGTTGKPKGAVHTHCGFPIKAAQDMLHGFDVQPDEVIYWITDMGWMMGPWLVFGTLLLGATMVLYDGAVDTPGPDRIWSSVARHGVTMLGISPTLVRLLLTHGADPVRAHNLTSLRKFGSTGEPWNEEPWKWLFEVVGNQKLPIINYSGGTEISGGILCGNVLTACGPCAFAGPMPGMAVDVVDDAGNPVRGQVGELVIREPWIGMTRGFWNDPDRYIDAYWSKIPGMWVHGDWARVDPDGQWYILGRSDDTIKIAGKRLGPAEVETVLVANDRIAEAAAIGVPDELKGQALVCFCVPRDSAQANDALRKELSNGIITEMGKPLAPKAIRFVKELPKTRNGKIMRRVIRAAWLGESLGDTSALEHPSAIESIRQSY